MNLVMEMGLTGTTVPAVTPLMTFRSLKDKRKLSEKKCPSINSVIVHTHRHTHKKKTGLFLRGISEGKKKLRRPYNLKYKLNKLIALFGWFLVFLREGRRL